MEEEEGGNKKDSYLTEHILEEFNILEDDGSGESKFATCLLL